MKTVFMSTPTIEPVVRWGVGIPHQLLEQAKPLWDRSQIVFDGAPWYDWLLNNFPDSDYTRLVFADPMPAQEAAIIGRMQAAPQLQWNFWNEPEWDRQSNIEPERAAQVMRRIRSATSNPIGLWGGLICWPHAYKWFKDYAAAGGPIPDIFTAHIYAYDAYDFTTQLTTFRKFVQPYSIIDPVIDLTEVGGWNADVASQIGIMQAAHAAMSNGRVRRVYWYSSHCSSIPGFEFWDRTDLLDKDGNLKPLGREFLRLKEVQVYKINLPFIAC